MTDFDKFKGRTFMEYCENCDSEEPMIYLGPTLEMYGLDVEEDPSLADKHEVKCRTCNSNRTYKEDQLEFLKMFKK